MTEAKTKDHADDDKKVLDAVDDGRQPGTDLTDPNSTALQVMDFGDDAGAGMEGAGADEFVVPIIAILAGNSPQCDASKGQPLPGAKPGMFYNTATGELIDGAKGFVFVPVHRDHNYPEFTPRNLGGGFVGTHAPDSDMVIQLRAKYGNFGRLYTSEKRTNDGMPAEGTELQETFYLYGLMVDEASGMVQRVILPFKSTQIRKYKGFMSRVDAIRYMGVDNKPVKPPLWAHRWRVTTQPESNKKGSFFGYVLRLAAQDADGIELPLINSLIKRSDPLYVQGREFYDLLREGKARADFAGAQKAEGDGKDDEDIPM